MIQEVESYRTTALKAPQRPLEAPRTNAIVRSDTYDLVTKYAEKNKLDVALVHRIVKAESGYKNIPNYLYTSEKGKYTAYGIFQITRSTYKQFCGDPSERLDEENNIACAMKIITTSGYQHWDESKKSWSR